MSVLHVPVHATCPCPCCMPMSMLHSMSMLHVHVHTVQYLHVHALLHVHVNTACSSPCSPTGTFSIDMYMPHRHGQQHRHGYPACTRTRDMEEDIQHRLETRFRVDSWKRKKFHAILSWNIGIAYLFKLCYLSPLYIGKILPKHNEAWVWKNKISLKLRFPTKWKNSFSGNPYFAPKDYHLHQQHHWHDRNQSIRPL